MIAAPPAGTAAGVTPALTRLLAPVTLAEFVTRHWRRQELHVARGTPGYFADLLRLEDVDTLLAYGAADGRRAYGVSAIDALYARDGAESQLTLCELFDNFARGHALALYELERRWPAAARLHAELQTQLGHPISLTAYLSPPESQALPAHWDTYDLLALQLHGAKEWRLWPREKGEQEEPADARRVTLRDGDSLYVPAGTMHRVFAGAAPSLHVSVRVEPFTRRDLLRATAEAWLERQGGLDEPLLLGALGAEGSGGTSDLQAEGGTLTAALRLEDGAHGLRRRLREGLHPLPDGHFAQLARLDEIDLGSELERRPGQWAEVEERPEQWLLRFVGGLLPGPRCAKIAAAFSFFAGCQRFVVGDLPDLLTPADKRLLCRQLVRRGYLRLAA